MPLRVVLADDQPKVRFALRVLLENRTDVVIVGEVDDALELAGLLAKTSPNVIILDWLLPGLPALGSIRSLRDLSPDAVIIALSGRPELGQEALRNGADAFVSKIDPPDRLQEIMDQIVTTRFSSELPQESTS